MAIVLALAALWNLGFVVLTRNAQSGPTFLVIGLLGTLVFGYFALRGFLHRSRVSFTQGRLVCRSGPLWPRSHFEHDTQDITGFVAEPNPTKNEQGHVVTLVTRTNARLPLPLSLNGLVLSATTGADTPFSGVAPEGHALHIARELDAALEIVRHEGGNYRVAPGFAEPASVEAKALPDVDFDLLDGGRDVRSERSEKGE